MSNDSEYKCPSCHHTVPITDIHVEKNIALCRNCGADHAFSDLINEKEHDNILADPPKNLSIEKTAHGITMTFWKARIFAIAITIFAFILTGMVWGVMIPKMAQESTLSLLFCIPFVFFDVLILCFAIFFLLGKSTISVTPGKGVYSCGIGILKFSRQFKLTSQTKFGKKIIGHSNGVPIMRMTINNPAEKPITLGHLISDDAFPYIKFILNSLKN